MFPSQAVADYCRQIWILVWLLQNSKAAHTATRPNTARIVDLALLDYLVPIATLPQSVVVAPRIIPVLDLDLALDLLLARGLALPNAFGLPWRLAWTSHSWIR